MLDLSPIESRVAAATKGPWNFRRTKGGSIEDTYCTNARIMQAKGVNGNSAPSRVGVVDKCTTDDIAFIVHSREDVELLIAEVKRLRQFGN